MNLPNALTILRFLLAIGFILALRRAELRYVILATILFLVATITDFFDGYFAKKKNLVSNFGKIMDPIADKFLLLSAFFIFMRMQLIAPWMFYVILVREVVVTGSRLLAVSKGIVIAAEQIGKYKTVSQMIAVCGILSYLWWAKMSSPVIVPSAAMDQWQQFIFVLMVLTVGLTLFSGISYFWNNRGNLTRLLY